MGREKKKAHSLTRRSDGRSCWWFYECTRVRAHTYTTATDADDDDSESGQVSCPFPATLLWVRVLVSVCAPFACDVIKIDEKSICSGALNAFGMRFVRKTTAECTHWFVFGSNTVSALIQQMKGHRKVDFGERFYLFFFFSFLHFICSLSTSFVRSFVLCFKFIFSSLFVVVFSSLIRASTWLTVQTFCWLCHRLSLVAFQDA